MRRHARPTHLLRLAAPCAALAVAACADPAAPTAATRAAGAGPRMIVNGRPTGDAFRSVGALLFDFDGNGVINADDELCTGSLVAPTVFLTAAHCVEFLPAGAQLHVSFDPALTQSPADAIPAARFVYDPRYGKSSRAQLYDLAVVILPAGRTADRTPLRLPTLGLLDQLAGRNGLRDATFFNVGYGTANTRTGKPAFPYDGVRKVSTSPFMALTQTWLGLQINANATGQGGDCYGDSGGPKFLDRDGYRDVVMATVTTGDVPCRATTWDWRTDTPEARSFLGAHGVPLP